MPDWTKSMQQTFEYYVVDPTTWKETRQLHTVKSCSISRDSEVETLGSATIDIIGNIEECYIRVYLITIQNEVTERYPLGTFLVQTPSFSYDGKIQSVTMDAYTPLLELKETGPQLGYTIARYQNIMDKASQICYMHARAPVVEAKCDMRLDKDFVANINDTWVTYVRDLISKANYTLALDELGRILFAPVQRTETLQAVWTYDDGNSSILYPDITIEHDLYGIPNVIEVIYSTEESYISSRVVNDDPSSPTSTINRGREITKRISNPSLPGDSTQRELDEYAKRALKELSTVEYTVTYTHGYCGTRLGDCIRLDYASAGMRDIKGKIISQTIKCEPGCPVTEKAIFTTSLWG